MSVIVIFRSFMPFRYIYFDIMQMQTLLLEQTFM